MLVQNGHKYVVRAIIFFSSILLLSNVGTAFKTRALITRYPSLKKFYSLYRIQLNQPSISKRARLSYQREIEICPSTTVWKNLTTAYASDGRSVEIMQDPLMGQQWFYTVSCKTEHENKPCRLISDEYPTTCRTRYNLVPAFIHKPGQEEPFGFTMIKIPGQCVCVEMATVEMADPRWLDVSREDFK